MFKVIIAGGRDFDDYELMRNKCCNILSMYEPKDVEIVSGEATGADKLGERFAEEQGTGLCQFPADWNLGKMAGIIRNRQMAKYADALIAFWDGKSRGTMNMIYEMRQLNKPTRVIRYDKL